MGDSKKFFEGFSVNSGPSRGIADITSVPEEQEEVPSAQVMIDALYYAMITRLEEMDQKLERILQHVEK